MYSNNQYWIFCWIGSNVKKKKKRSYIPDRHSAPRQAVEEKNIESSRDTRHNEPTNVSATADSFNANFPDNIDNWEIPPWLPTITFRLRRLLKQNNDIHGRFVEILEDLSRTEHIHTKHLNLPKSDHHRHFENWHTKKFRCNAAYEYEKLSRFILDCAKLGYWKSIGEICFRCLIKIFKVQNLKFNSWSIQ